MDMIPFCRPSFGREEEATVVQVLRSGWIVEGLQTQHFESELALYIGAPYVITVAGATDALYMLLATYSVREGDEVIIPSFTMAATAQVVARLGAAIVFADIKPYPSLCLDPNDVAAKITQKTKAIIPVHFAGNRADTDYRDLVVIEDSAHRIERNCMGTNPAAFSFHAIKNLTTGRGGAIGIHDREKAQWLLKARNFGISQDTRDRYEKVQWRYDVEFVGLSSHLIDLLSAIGRVQLSKLDGFLTQRARIVSRYNKILGLRNTGLHLYPILVHKRDAFIDYMQERKVQCSVHFIPLHTVTAYRQKVDLPVTSFVADHVVSLPLYPSLSSEQVDYIADLTNAWTHRYGTPS